MKIVQLINEFHKKYNNNLLHDFTIFLDTEKNNDTIDFNNIDDKEKKIVNYCNSLFYDLFIKDESMKSLEYTISPPFVLENINKKIYITCPYYDNDKLKNATCLPIGMYDCNLKLFNWLNDSVRGKMKYHYIGKNVDMFIHSQINEIDLDTARNLILLFRALWFELDISFTYNDCNVTMKTNSLISFRINDTPSSQSKILFCLIDIGLNQQDDKIKSKIELLEELIFNDIEN